MPLLYYRDALKQGQKEFHACVSKGEYPYLPVLEDFVSAEDRLRIVDLGTIQIPLSFVRGTRTSGRTQAFARNFMPLMDEGSEFALKWKALCQSQVEEGIREPIKAYEYMNRYYVEEGNKRVSVLKFLDADSIYAHVLRVLPRRDGSRVVELQCSDRLPDSTKKLAALLQNDICSGNCHPFRGPLYGQSGRAVIGPEETLTTEQIINMDWLADNIVGTIPAYRELDETAKATVGIVGVDAAVREKQNQADQEGRPGGGPPTQG